jgi:hypothetical protein
MTHSTHKLIMYNNTPHIVPTPYAVGIQISPQAHTNLKQLSRSLGLPYKGIGPLIELIGQGIIALDTPHTIDAQGRDNQ